MSDDKHTPGPWTFEVNGDGYPIKGAINGYPVRIATVHGMKSHDAKLIAAAPELLALARQYASECGECNGTGRVHVESLYDHGMLGVEPLMQATNEPCPDCADIRAVIAKAVGL